MKLIQAMTSGLQAKRHIPCTSETPASVSGRSLALPLPPWQPLLPIAGMPAHHAGSPMWRSCLQSQGCLPLPLQQLLWLQLRGGEGETHGNRSENQPRMYDQHTFGTAKALTLKIPAAAMAPGLLVLCTLSMPLTPKRLPCGCD